MAKAPSELRMQYLTYLTGTRRLVQGTSVNGDPVGQEVDNSGEVCHCARPAGAPIEVRDSSSCSHSIPTSICRRTKVEAGIINRIKIVRRSIESRLLLIFLSALFFFSPAFPTVFLLPYCLVLDLFRG